MTRKEIRAEVNRDNIPGSELNRVLKNEVEEVAAKGLGLSVEDIRLPESRTGEVWFSLFRAVDTVYDQETQRRLVAQSAADDYWRDW